MIAYGNDDIPFLVDIVLDIMRLQIDDGHTNLLHRLNSARMCMVGRMSAG